MPDIEETSPQASPENPTAAPDRGPDATTSLGIDIGGSAIKGAPVDTATGKLLKTKLRDDFKSRAKIQRTSNLFFCGCLRAPTCTITWAVTYTRNLSSVKGSKTAFVWI